MQRIIDEIKGCLEHQYYFAALILSLAIPDVCLSYEEKKVKNLDSYSEWCKKWFDRDFDISGEVIYALRCAMMHSLNSDIESQRSYQNYRRDKKQEDSRKEHFRFYIPDSDSQEKIIYVQEDRKSIEHELCINRLIYQISVHTKNFKKRIRISNITKGKIGYKRGIIHVPIQPHRGHHRKHRGGGIYPGGAAFGQLPERGRTGAGIHPYADRPGL